MMWPPNFMINRKKIVIWNKWVLQPDRQSLSWPDFNVGAEARQNRERLRIFPFVIVKILTSSLPLFSLSHCYVWAVFWIVLLTCFKPIFKPFSRLLLSHMSSHYLASSNNWRFFKFPNYFKSLSCQIRTTMILCILWMYYIICNVTTMLSVKRSVLIFVYHKVSKID